MRTRYLTLVSISVTLFLSACSPDQSTPNNNQPEQPKTSTAEVLNNPLPPRLESLSANWETNWEKHTIPYDEFVSGGPPRDGIPSIENPEFISLHEAKDWLSPEEPVMVVDIDGDARAYPLQILIWHEIVNDVVGDKPVLISFCPLCNSAIVFDREANGEIYEFGTSGLLVNSDLVMYDRTTETLWQQLTGEAIVGDLVGNQLTMLTSSLVSFENFMSSFPDGIVMSRETGHDRKYGQNPYQGYDSRSSTLFSKEEDHGQLPAMERVVAVSLDNEDKAYPYSVLLEQPVIHDQIAGEDVVIFFKKGTASALDSKVIADGKDVGASGVFHQTVDGEKRTFTQDGNDIVDNETGSTWDIFGKATSGPLEGSQLEPIVHGNHFWFSWVAFKPSTDVYQ